MVSGVAEDLKSFTVLTYIQLNVLQKQVSGDVLDLYTVINGDLHGRTTQKWNKLNEYWSALLFKFCICSYYQSHTCITHTCPLFCTA